MLKEVLVIEVSRGGVEPVFIGGHRPMVLISGPCVIEREDVATRIAVGLQSICHKVGIPFIFKASFDKANRTSINSFRGVGIDEGLEILLRIRNRLGAPVTTDVHLPQQVGAVSEVVDLLQVPAFLSRQTDLLVACA